jgi:hypothetical protein
MNHEANILLLKAILFIAGFISILFFLGLVWGREQVKKDLLRQGFAPINVRWRPFAYWAWLKETGFTATFVDATGCIQTARCALWFSKVRWIAADVKYLNKNLPRAGKLAYLIISLLLLDFGLKHLVTQELILPPSFRQSQPRPIYLHGWPLDLMSFAAICYAASLITAIVYCYRIRANERNYIFISRGLSIFSWVLFWLSLGVYSYQFFQDPNQFYFTSH